MGVLLEQLPMIEFRRYYATAEMIAFVGNALGGKQESKPKVNEKPFDPFSPMDFLPFFARPAGFIDAVSGIKIPEAAAIDFLENTRKGLVPDWVLNFAPINTIRTAAKGR